jgi:hypothetical protein
MPRLILFFQALYMVNVRVQVPKLIKEDEIEIRCCEEADQKVPSKIIKKEVMKEVTKCTWY